MEFYPVWIRPFGPAEFPWDRQGGVVRNSTRLPALRLQVFTFFNPPLKESA